MIRTKVNGPLYHSSALGKDWLSTCQTGFHILNEISRSNNNHVFYIANLSCFIMSIVAYSCTFITLNNVCSFSEEILEIQISLITEA